MAITQQKLGRRIRAAREACRLTQEEVADRIAVSRPTVVQIEAGNRSVSSLELDRFARVFGRDIRDFVADSFEAEDTLAALFRAEPDVRDRAQVVEALETCLSIARAQVELERRLGIERGPVGTASYPLAAPRSRWDAIQQGERVAEEERRRLGLGETPLPDLGELLETQGIRTEIVDLPDDISGLTLNDKRLGVLVVANRAHHVLRRRFSLAHECAHALIDRSHLSLVSRTSERHELLEVRANAFAAGFLMPEEGVRHFVAGLGKGGPSRLQAEVFDEAGILSVEGRNPPGSQILQLYDVVQIAHHFGVSVLAALYRLRNLRLLGEAQFDNLKALDDAGAAKQLGRDLGLPEADHAELRDRFRHRFVTLALEAYRREEISRGKLVELASLVGLDTDDLGRLIVHAGLEEDIEDPG